MKTHFTKEEFTFIDNTNPYGYTHRLPKLLDGTVLKRVFEPSRNQVVLMSTERGLQPVLILEGKYRSNGRISNFWYWQEIEEDLSLGKKDSGYGGFFHCPVDIQVHTSIELAIAPKNHF